MGIVPTGAAGTGCPGTENPSIGAIFWLALSSYSMVPVSSVRSLLVCAFLVQSLAAQSLFVKPVRVLGDPHFIGTAASPLSISSQGPNGVEGKELQAPTGVALDTSVSPPILYVADTGNNRVLGFQYTTQSAAGSVADLILGQPDRFTTNSATSTSFSAPTGLVVDSSGNLYVADTGHNRILRYQKPFNQPPGVQFPDLILGQTTFAGTTANPGGVKATTLSLLVQNQLGGRAGLAFDSSGNLWVADLGNNRVLRYPSSVLKAGQNGPAADLSVGQPDLLTATSSTSRASKIGMARPTGISFDSAGRMYVTDALARVLVFAPGIGFNAAASRILGADPTVATNAPSAITLAAQAQAVNISGSNVLVADSGNNRVQIYPAFDKWSAENIQFSPSATQVLGQEDFTSFLSNRGGVNANGNTLSGPQDLASSSTEVYVADTANNRILVFPINSGVIGSIAFRVIGQTDFIYRGTNMISGSEFSMSAASAVIIDTNSKPQHLYIADTLNNRVLGFRDFRTLTQGQKADLVIGQQDFSKNVVNYPTGKAAEPSERGLNGPRGLALDSDGNLYVADANNSRVLRFPQPFASGITALQNADLVLGQAGFFSSVTDATQRTMGAPVSLAFTKDGADSAKSTGWLVVADAGHDRVLMFPKPFTSGMNASHVLGASDFTSGTGDSGATHFSGPGGVAVDPQDRIVVADSGNGRIQIYPSVSLLARTGSPPSVSVTAGLNQPVSIAMTTEGQFWVADNGLNQLLHFPAVDQLPLTTPAYSPDTGLAARTPRYAFVDRFNNLLVADGANRILYFAPQVNVANAGNYINGRALAAGTFASIFATGTNVLSTETAAGNSQPLPTVAADIQVLLNGKPAALSYVSPAQINLPLPLSLPTGGSLDLQVVKVSSGQIMGSAEVALSSASPALFILGGAQSGPVAARNEDNSLNSASNPATRGSIIQLFGTGQGPVINPPPDGEASAGPVETVARPQVVLGLPGTLVPVENIKYSGLAPGFVGLWQINVEIPATAPSGGSVPITVYMNSIPSTNPASPTQIITTISIK